MNQPENAPDNQPLVISYLTIRKAIGFLGLLLPVILFAGVFVFTGEEDIQPSISDYYYTIMRNGFVGILCAVALFLFAYRGYEKLDRIAGYLGSIFALGVAFFPTDPNALPADTPGIIGTLHLAFASLFFATLIFFSLFLFTRTGNPHSMTGRKKMRNTVYLVCGYIMTGCLLFIALYFLVLEHSIPGIGKYDVIFWCESVALMAFGISWLVKGEFILKDLIDSTTT